jgi:hypothetical protein
MTVSWGNVQVEPTLTDWIAVIGVGMDEAELVIIDNCRIECPERSAKSASTRWEG